MARTKKAVIANVSLEDAQEASSLFAANQNKLAKIEAKMNQEINVVKDKYSDEITSLKKNTEHPLAVLEAFANEQYKNWGKKKSTSLLHTVIGFRTGNRTVTKGKVFTWEGIIENAKKLFPAFVRTKIELNKEAILALKENDPILEKMQESLNISIEQGETFFIDVKAEEVALVD